MIIQLLQRGKWGSALADLAVTENLVVAAHLIDAEHPTLWYGSTLRELELDEHGEPRSDVEGIVSTPILPAREDLEQCAHTIDDMMNSDDYGTSALERLAATASNELSPIVLEPLRWTFALYPKWVAQDAPPQAAPLFRAEALALQTCGYTTWTGIAEVSGLGGRVRRAMLSASRVVDVVDPLSTLLYPDEQHVMDAEWLLLRQLTAVH